MTDKSETIKKLDKLDKDLLGEEEFERIKRIDEKIVEDLDAFVL